MTGQRDIERTLDAWFVDGPSVMPDRLFDAVLDQVERTPQRPFARLRLRLTEMNPRIRLFTVLAAGLVAVVAGVALIGGGSNVRVTASPSPTVAASADTTVPSALRGRWSGGSRAVPDIDPEAGTTLAFTATAAMFGQINDLPNPTIRGTASAPAPDRILVQTTLPGQGCAVGDEGQYLWALSSSGSTLTITAESEDCPMREDAFVGIWLVDACPSTDGLCLGPLDAGDHASQAFDPYLADAGAWEPRFGVFRYTVPDGWANAEDWPSTYSLLPRREYDTYDPTTCGEICPDAITLLARASAAEQGDTCESRAEPGVGRTAAELIDWLTSLPGLATTTTQVTVDGQPATAIDLEVAESWTGTCPSDPPIVGVPLLTEVDGWHWAIFAGDRYRVIPVDLGGGDTVVMIVDTRDASTFDAFIAEAMPLIETFDFTR